MADKPVNYTPEQTASMLEAYANGATVETIAQNLGKTVRSVVAKLSREGVYKSKEAARAGERAPSKGELASYIAAALRLTVDDAESLTKANKPALLAVADFIRNERS